MGIFTRYPGLVAAALCAWLWCGPALSQTESAETMLHEGILRFKVGKFSRSMRILKRALRKASDPLVKAKIQLYLGLNQGIEGNPAKAETAFRQALTLDPTLVLNKDQTKESLLQIFARARSSLSGKVSVSADRPDATLHVDGKLLGPLPHQGALSVGKHTLEVTVTDGRWGYSGELLVRVGQDHQLELTLAPLTGTLQLQSKPPGATIKVDGKPHGKTPLRALHLAPGEHQLELELAGHKSLTQQVELVAGRQTRLQLELAPLARLPRPVLVPVEPQPDRRSGRLWTWIVAGSAVAVAGAGLGLGLWAESGWDDYQEAAGSDRVRYDQLHDEVPGRATAANVTFAVAGALAITSVVLFFLEAPGDKSTAARASVSPGGLNLGCDF